MCWQCSLPAFVLTQRTLHIYSYDLTYMLWILKECLPHSVSGMWSNACSSFHVMAMQGFVGKQNCVCLSTAIREADRRVLVLQVFLFYRTLHVVGSGAVLDYTCPVIWRWRVEILLSFLSYCEVSFSLSFFSLRSGASTLPLKLVCAIN